MYIELLKKTEPNFPDIASPASVTAMKIWLCKYKTLAPVKSFVNLKTLIINGLPDADPSWLSELTQLEYLWIQNPSKIKSLGFLRPLNKLHSLSLSTPPSWDTSKKVIEVESLAPIAELAELRNIELFGVFDASKSLAALKQCKNLERARFNGYAKSTTEDFYMTTKAANEFAPDPSLP